MTEILKVLQDANIARHYDLADKCCSKTYLFILPALRIILIHLFLLQFKCKPNRLMGQHIELITSGIQLFLMLDEFLMIT